MIFFRVDGNEIIGLGHVMRCLSIAEAFRDNGVDVLFVIADSKCSSIIKDKGFNLSILNSKFSDMESEIDLLSVLIDEYKPEMLLIDSYYVTYYYLYSLKNKAQTVYIDDVLSFPYPVDIVINYNIFSSKDAYNDLYIHEENKPRFLLGTEYVPLRKEFSECKYKEPNRIVKNILVSTGGADTEHISVKLLEYLSNHPESMIGCTIKLVVGAANKDLDTIKELAESIPNVELKINVKNMRCLMEECDLAVSAAGSTLYELCVCCVPTITYVIADNQLPAANAFREQGLMVSIGDLRNVGDVGKLIVKSIKESIINFLKREKQVNNSFYTINQNGSKKIVYTLLCINSDLNY